MFIIWGILLFYCTGALERDWNKEFQRDAQKSLTELKSLENPMEKEHIALSLLNSNPKEAVELCALVQTTIGKQTCSRFKTRPHLWTIEEKDASFWNGGKLGERLIFPRSFQVKPKTDLKVDTSACQGNQVCLRTKAEEILYTEEAAKTNWEEAAQYCLAIEENRGQHDCLFHLSESVPVHIENYIPAVSLCVMSKPYAGECHNHLLLRFSSSFWTKIEWHEALIAKFNELYFEPAYIEELTNAYWSIVAFRVVGMMMPLQTAEFLSWPEEFQPHLRSALALRVWDDADPILMAKRALNREPQRVSKARGPGAPRFRARPLWKTQNDNLRWIRFCDLRGGFRPVHSDPDIDLIWAILTASAMTEPLNIEFWNNIDQTKWEVRWAMAHLLKELNLRDHTLYQKFSKDEDQRVRMVIQ